MTKFQVFKAIVFMPIGILLVIPLFTYIIVAWTVILMKSPFQLGDSKIIEHNGSDISAMQLRSERSTATDACIVQDGLNLLRSLRRWTPFSKFIGWRMRVSSRSSWILLIIDTDSDGHATHVVEYDEHETYLGV